MTGRYTPKDNRKEGFRKRIPNRIRHLAPQFPPKFFFPAAGNEPAWSPNVESPRLEIKISLGTHNTKVFNDRLILALKQYNEWLQFLDEMKAPLQGFQIDYFAKEVFKFYGKYVTDPRWKVDNISTLHSFHSRMNEVCVGEARNDRSEYHKYRGVLPFAEYAGFNEFFNSITEFDDKKMMPLYDIPEYKDDDPSREAVFSRVAAITFWWLALKRLDLKQGDIDLLMMSVEEIRTRFVYVGFAPTIYDKAKPISKDTPVSTRSSQSTTDMTMKGLYLKWKNERSRYVHGTQRLWDPIVAAIEEFFGVKPISSLAREDFVLWKEHLLSTGKRIENIQGSYLKVASVMMNFALRNTWITQNPLRPSIIKLPARSKRRYLPYQDTEISIILESAMGFYKEDRFRWIAWILAATGARITEVTALGADQIINEYGMWMFNFQESEDGATLKNDNAFRKVPIHHRLLKDGFLDFVQGKTGPLFYTARFIDPRSAHPSKNVGSKHAAWIKTLAKKGISFEKKRPNHSFRSWFRTHQVELNVLESITDRIVGHKLVGERETYITLDLARKMQVAINKIDFDTLGQIRN